MGHYIGTKLINAREMTRQEYYDFRGWQLPDDENGDDAGYLVEYLDGGKANTEQYAGYVSWSPKEVFERAYQPTSGMDFGMAIAAMKQGKKVCRAGWNGKGMWLCLIHGWDIPDETHPHRADIDDLETLSWIGMKTAQGQFVPWLASQTDVLVTDWMIVE